MPFIVRSPYARPGFTDSTVTSSTGSILAFIESDFGLAPLNANDAGGVQPVWHVQLRCRATAGASPHDLAPPPCAGLPD